MIINKVELIPVTVPLEQPIGHAFYKRTNGKHVIVKIYTDDGFMGIGCSSVLAASYCMDNQESTLAKLKEPGRECFAWRQPHAYGDVA